MNYGWMIELQNRPAQFLTDIWIYRRGTNNKTIVYRYKGNDVVEETEEDQGSARLPATFVLPTDLVPILLEAIIAKGVKPPEQSFVQGKLEATETHLKDLRQLLKLTPPNIK